MFRIQNGLQIAFELKVQKLNPSIFSAVVGHREQKS